jgi:hypothetical protein
VTVDPSILSAFANETYDYKGANSMARKYPSYPVHQTWWFDDAGLSRQMADLEEEKAALKQEICRYRVFGCSKDSHEATSLTCVAMYH